METNTDFKFEHDRGGNSNLNFNTVVGVIALGAISWVGKATSENNDKLTKIETTLPYVTQSVSSLEAKMSQLVTRSELESRLSENAAKAAVLERRLMVLEFEKKVTPAPQP